MNIWPESQSFLVNIFIGFGDTSLPELSRYKLRANVPICLITSKQKVCTLIKKHRIMFFLKMHWFISCFVSIYLSIYLSASVCLFTSVLNELRNS